MPWKTLGPVRGSFYRGGWLHHSKQGQAMPIAAPPVERGLGCAPTEYEAIGRERKSDEILPRRTIGPTLLSLSCDEKNNTRRNNTRKKNNTRIIKHAFFF
jgi:hypothetical protein